MLFTWSMNKKAAPRMGGFFIHASGKRLGKSCTRPGFRVAEDVDYLRIADDTPGMPILDLTLAPVNVTVLNDMTPNMTPLGAAMDRELN